MLEQDSLENNFTSNLACFDSENIDFKYEDFEDAFGFCEYDLSSMLEIGLSNPSCVDTANVDEFVSSLPEEKSSLPSLACSLSRELDIDAFLNSNVADYDECHEREKRSDCIDNGGTHSSSTFSVANTITNSKPNIPVADASRPISDVVNSIRSVNSNNILNSRRRTRLADCNKMNTLIALRRVRYVSNNIKSSDDTSKVCTTTSETVCFATHPAKKYKMKKASPKRVGLVCKPNNKKTSPKRVVCKPNTSYKKINTCKKAGIFDCLKKMTCQRSITIDNKTIPTLPPPSYEAMSLPRRTTTSFSSFPVQSVVDLKSSSDTLIKETPGPGNSGLLNNLGIVGLYSCMNKDSGIHAKKMHNESITNSLSAKNQKSKGVNRPSWHDKSDYQVCKARMNNSPSINLTNVVKIEIYTKPPKKMIITKSNAKQLTKDGNIINKNKDNQIIYQTNANNAWETRYVGRFVKLLKMHFPNLTEDIRNELYLPLDAVRNFKLTNNELLCLERQIQLLHSLRKLKKDHIKCTIASCDVCNKIEVLELELCQLQKWKYNNAQAKKDDFKSIADAIEMKSSIQRKKAQELRNLVHSFYMSLRSNNNSNAQTGCNCSTDCRSILECACVQRGAVCEDCTCSPCENPLNTLQLFSFNFLSLRMDTCLMQTIYNMTFQELVNVLNFEHTTPCCRETVKVCEVIPNVVVCVHCRAYLSYSWCDHTVRDENSFERNHCVICCKCVQPLQSHCYICATCTLTTFTGRCLQCEEEKIYAGFSMG